MKMTTILSLFLLGITFCCSAAETLGLISGGKSDYAIVIPDEDPRNRVRLAAEALQKYIREASGCELPVFKESDAPKDKPTIQLGKTRKAVTAGIPFDKLHDWVYCKKVIGNDLYLAGYDASANIHGDLSYHDREYLGQLQGKLNMEVTDRSYKEWHGTYKAVLSFLEKELGVRFLLPGENGRYIPKLDKLEVPTALDFFGASRFQYCYGRNYGDLETTIALNHNDIPFYKNYGGHSFNVAVPAGKYGKTNPEYFVMVDGKRRPDYGPAGGNHLCISNPEVQELMLKEIERQYANGFRWIQVAPTDGQVPCSCPECLRIGNGSQSELQWIVFRKLAEAMKTRRPDAKLVFLSYGYTKAPPTTFTEFPDNVVIEYTIWNNFEEKFKEWEVFKSVPKLTYIYYWGSYNSMVYSPVRSVAYLAKNTRIQAENNVQGIFKCGWAVSLGLEGPGCYVFSKLLEDPTADEKALLDDFYHAAYGKAYEPMKKFFDTLHAALDTPNGESVLDVLEGRPRNPEQLHSFVYRPGMIHYMAQMLQMAERVGDPDPRVAARIKLVRREFDYLQCRVNLSSYMNAFNLSGAAEMLPVIERELDVRRKMVDSWYDENGNMKHEPGFYWPILEDNRKEWILFGGGQILPPFPRELDRGIEPLKLALNSKSSPEENTVDCESLNGEGARDKFFAAPIADDRIFGKGIAPTLFKAARDAENLYLLIECRFDNLKWGTEEVEAWAGSAPCLSQESLEIYLDTAGDRRRFVYFQFNPKPNSSKDGRVGYDDPTHPDFGKSDTVWQSGKWKYDLAIEPGKHRWVAKVTIPFAALGMNSPAPGAFWNMNVIRRHFPYPPEFNDNRALVAPWSRHPASNDFSMPENYGRINFK